jgi:hypothetical protein
MADGFFDGATGDEVPLIDEIVDWHAEERVEYAEWEYGAVEEGGPEGLDEVSVALGLTICGSFCDGVRLFLC